MKPFTEPVRVLHVDDDADFRDLTATFLERQNEYITVRTAAHSDEASEMLAARDIECIVSDYDMPGMNGIEFLDSVRESLPEIPFILFTNKGSEEVASKAISKGVTDYLQKDTSVEQYELLCHRIENAVEKYRGRTNYLELFEQAPIGLTIHNPETGAILDANQSFADLLGYEREALEGTHPGDLSPPDSPFTREQANELIQKAINEGPQTFQWQDQTKSGDALWMEVALKRATINNQPRILATIREITDRKQREHDLQRYETIVESIPAPLIVFDSDSRVRVVNNSVSEQLGLSGDELIGKQAVDLFTEHFDGADEDTVASITEQTERVLAGDIDSFRIEVPFERNGQTAVGEVTFGRVSFAEMTGVVSIACDITRLG